MFSQLQHSQSAFAKFNADVLAQVFAVDITDVSLSDGAQAPIPGEAVVASLAFSGEHQGRMWLATEKSKIRPIIEDLLERYQIATPVEDSAVFAEMLNMCAANLATAISSQVSITISPPDTVWPAVSSFPGERFLAVTMQTRQAQAFTFYYAF